VIDVAEPSRVPFAEPFFSLNGPWVLIELRKTWASLG
jgi:hypothetical protein